MFFFYSVVDKITHCLVLLLQCYPWLHIQISAKWICANGYLICYYWLWDTQQPITFEGDMRTVWTSFIIHTWSFFGHFWSLTVGRHSLSLYVKKNPKNKPVCSMRKKKIIQIWNDTRVSKWWKYFSFCGVNHSLQSKPQHFSKTMHVKHLHKPQFFCIFVRVAFLDFQPRKQQYISAELCSARPGKLRVNAWSLMYISSSTHTLL